MRTILLALAALSSGAAFAAPGVNLRDPGFSGEMPGAVTPHVISPDRPEVSSIAPPPALLAFDSMYALSGGFTEHDVRGLTADGMPRQLEHASGRLSTTGHLHLELHGLVFAEGDADVPDDLAGTSDDLQLRAVVSCLALAEDDDSQVVTRNVTTRAFPASDTGDVVIDAQLTLPEVCAAPVIFVVGGESMGILAMSGGLVSEPLSTPGTPRGPDDGETEGPDDGGTDDGSGGGY